MRWRDGLIVGLLALLNVVSATSCGAKSCNQVGCMSGVRVDATLRGSGRWYATFCRDGSCAECTLRSTWDGTEPSAGCENLAYQSGIEAGVGAALIQGHTTDFPEGQKLSLSIRDENGTTVAEWSGVVHYEPYEISEGPGCEPARCVRFNATVPAP